MEQAVTGPVVEVTASAAGSATHPLDNPVYASLTGPHALFAERRGRAVRYPAAFSPFIALPDNPDTQDWADVAALVGPGAIVPLVGDGQPPDGWKVVFIVSVVQLVDEAVVASPDDEAIRLNIGDVPEMLALIDRTKPGPFLPRTIELGTYLGIRRRGELIAMAGERLHPPGWTEISAVCTDAAYRGQGLGTRLVHAVAHGIRQRGETPFMHAAADNTPAIRLYESLGFRLRRKVTFQGIQIPEDRPAD
jgi:ribosomal protein S18 acetylase RimI-like enzyme